MVAEYGAIDQVSPIMLGYMYKGLVPGSGSRNLAFPVADSNAPGNNSWWTVMNLGSGTAHVNAYYYNTNGSLHTGPVPYTIPPGRSLIEAVELGGPGKGLTGSLVVVSDDENIAGYSSLDEQGRLGSGYDVIGCYGGTNF
jgi:hypothetical protein